jgi:hypothetical protein
MPSGAPAGGIGPAEQAPGFHHQHHRHQREDRHQRHLREDEDAEGAQFPDQQRGEKSAQHRTQPADDGDDEGVGDHAEVHAGGCGRARDLQRAAQPGEERAEEQRPGEEQRLIDAERADHLAVLPRGADQHAEARPVQDQPQRGEHQRADGDEEQLIGGEALAENIDAAPQAGRARAGDVQRPPELQHHILGHQHHTEGGQQLEQLRRLVDAPEDQHLHRHAGEPDDSRREQHPQDEGRQRIMVVEQRGDDGHTEIGAEHEEGAMREIHDPRDAENQRQPRGDDEQRGRIGEAGKRLRQDEGEVHSRPPAVSGFAEKPLSPCLRFTVAGERQAGAGTVSLPPEKWVFSRSTTSQIEGPAMAGGCGFSQNSRQM